MTEVRITLIGGPTALIEVEGFRLLTDPTFDAPGRYQLPYVTQEKERLKLLSPGIPTTIEIEATPVGSR